MTPEDRDFIHTTVANSAEQLRAELSAHIEQSLQTTRAELSAHIEQSQERTIEAMRDMQTEILRGLQAFATGNYARMHRIETSDTATNTRIEALEQRVLSLETRLHPPQ